MMVPLCPFKCPFQDDLCFVLIDFQKEFIELSRALLAPSPPPLPASLMICHATKKVRRVIGVVLCLLFCSITLGSDARCGTVTLSGCVSAYNRS